MRKYEAPPEDYWERGNLHVSWGWDSSSEGYKALEPALRRLVSSKMPELIEETIRRQETEVERLTMVVLGR